MSMQETDKPEPNLAGSFDSVAFLRLQTNKPGVYQMFDATDSILYVGKAKSLKKRLANYFQSGHSGKTRSLVGKIARIEVTVTSTETEALLLEQSLIKQQLPPYNILLRDDKSYPYIYISTDDEYPRIDFHRGARLREKGKIKGRYFGPYPSSGSVRESLQFLQKTFQVRQCEDNFFKNRSRPCLQFQIKRCTAPCVKHISVKDYAEDVNHTIMFLEGKEDTVMHNLADKMEQASAQLQFEQAAKYRDQISQLRHIQEQQIVEEGSNNVDIIAIALQSGIACVQLITVRHGRVLGSRSYFPKLKMDNTPDEIIAAFIAQYYLGYAERDIPRDIVVNIALHDEQTLLAEALSQHAGKKIRIADLVRGHRNKLKEMAERTAHQNVLGRIASQQNTQQRFERLQEVLKLDAVPERIECFDISHSSGESTVASCVVFDQNGPAKSDYRRFNIDADITPGDDYAAMKQALSRRYARIQQEEGVLPDLLLIDGGKGQLTQAHDVLRELQISSVEVVGVAKGSTRKAGFETLFYRDKDNSDTAQTTYREIVLQDHDPALHLIQQIRDEAHRFAITGHKQRRDKKRTTSRLESIPGVGAKRRRELLRFFGGQQEIARAGVDELARVPGISGALAQAIYDVYHEH